MVAIVTGTGLGVERGSGFVLGSRGQMGDASFGRLGENVTVNAATGNLAIQRTDEILIGVGPDRVVSRAYNSLGTMIDDNGDNWRLGQSRQIMGLTGTANASGSTVKRVDWDGSDTLYTYDTSRSCYVCKQGSGTYDTLTLNADLEGGYSGWTWKDGDTGLTESYSVVTDPHNSSDHFFGFLLMSTDSDGNALDYTYTGTNLLSQISSSTEHVSLTWSGTDLTQVVTTRTTGSSSTITRVRYTYDGSHRLSTVTTDLTPENNSVSDGVAVTTTYTYDSTSKRVATISQTGGAYLAITYTMVGSDYRVTQLDQTLASGVTATTALSYDTTTRVTTITDPRGQVTKMTYDTSGQLTRLDMPAAVSGGAVPYTTYAYNSNGDVTSATDANGNATVYEYDSHGNMTLTRGAFGTTMSWTYSSTDRVLTSTQYIVRDSDGAGSGTATSPVTARYAYNSNNDLRFVVSEMGEVTEYRYNSTGQQTAQIAYRDNTYNISSLAVTDPISESSLASWVTGISDKSTVERADTTYNFRGSIATITSYSKADSSGNGLTTSPYTVMTYTYDQAGNLLTRQTSGIANTETFVYDGLGRITSSVDLNNATTTFAFNDTTGTRTATLTSGMIQISSYDLAGRLVNYQELDYIGTYTTSYAYDANGNLRMVTDAQGTRHYFLYDNDNRRIADITLISDIGTTSPEGKLTEFRYDLAGRLTTTIKYAKKVTATQIASLVSGGVPANVSLSSVLPSLSSDTTDPDYWEWNVYDVENRLTGTVNSDGDVFQTVYDGTSKPIGARNYINQLSGTTIASLKGSWTNTMFFPTSDGVKDHLDYVYYDNDRRVIGTWNYATGITTQIIYNAAGQKVETIEYANTAPTYNANFATLVAGITTSVQDIHTRYFYNGRGELQYTLDSQLHVTEYVYDNTGRVSRTIAYNGTITATSTYTAAYVASQVSSLASSALTRVSWNVYDVNSGQLVYVIDAMGGVTGNTYDTIGRLTKQTRYYNAANSSSLSSASISSSPTQPNMTTWVGTYANSNDRVTRYYYYDGRYRVNYVLNVQGFLTQTGYDALGRQYSTIRYANQVTSVTDSTSLSTIITAAGSLSIAQQEYVVRDEAGRITDSFDGIGARTHYDYYNLDRVKYATRAYGSGGSEAVTYFIYDSAGHVVSQTEGNGTSYAATTTFTYDATGQMLSRTDPAGFITKFTYDSLGRTLSVAVPLDTSTWATTYYLYDSFGNVIQTTDPRGNKFYAFYDALNRVILTVDGEGFAAGTSYNMFGDVASTIRYAVKIAGTIVPGVLPYVATTTGVDEIVNYGHDKIGELTFSVDAEGGGTKNVYDTFGEVIQTSHFVTAYTGAVVLDTLPSFTTSSDDEITYYGYNNVGQRTFVLDAAGVYEQWGYDARGNLAVWVNKLGATVSYYYDNADRRTCEVIPATAVAPAIINMYAYDLRGNMLTKLEASGLGEQRTTTYTYDKLDRVVTTKGDGVAIVNSSWIAVSGTTQPTTTDYYDTRGNLIEQDDPMGARTLYYYDGAGRKIAQLSALAKLSTWTYDVNGNILTQTAYGDTFTVPGTPGGAPPSTAGLTDLRQTTYTYDKNNRLLTTTVASIKTYEYGVTTGTPPASSIVITNTYDFAGNIVRQTDARGNYSWFYFDRRNLKVAQVDQELYLTAYALNTDGNVKTETRFATKLGTAPSIGTLPGGTTDATNDRVTVFTYDKMGRRKSEARGNVAVVTLGSTTGVVVDSTTHIPVTSNVTATVSYTYNGLGEVLTKTEATGDVTTYTYDGFGRQKTVVSAAFTDVAGASNYATTTQTYDGLNNLLTSAVTNQTSGSGSRVTTYTYGAGGRLATMTDAGGLVHTYQYDLDGHQMVDKYSRLNSAGTTINEAALTAYNALGQVTSQRKSTWTTVWTDGDVTNLQYNAWGEIGAKGVNGLYQETFAYDYAGHLVRSTAGDGTVKFFLYDANGDQSATIATDGSNPSGRVWSTMSIDNALSDLTGSGIALGSTNVAGYAVTIATFDKRGQQLSTREPFRQLSVSSGTYTTATVVHSRTYNAFGEAASETDARGNVTNYTYNTVGKVTKRELPAVNYTNESGTAYTSVRPTDYTYYDASGRVVATMDANGNVNTRTLLAGTGYGGAEAMTVLEFHPDSGKFVSYYDGFGNMTKKSVNGIVNAISGSGEVDETFTYDAMGRVLTQTHPTRAAGTAGNATGSAQTLVDTYVYDGLGQRVKHYNSFIGSSAPETTDYDLQGRVVKTVDMDGYAMLYGYTWDSAIATTGLATFGGWTKTTSQLNTSGGTIRSMTEKQDYFGRAVAKTDYGSHTQTFNFDLAGRVSSVQNIAGAGSYDATTYTYNGLGQIASITTGFEVTWNYDFYGVRTSYSLGGSYSDLYNDTVADKTTSTYGYDADGNRTSETTVKEKWWSEHHYNGDEWTWIKHGYDAMSLENATATYDSNGRLATVSDSGYNAGAPIAITWKYDLNANIREASTTYRALSATGVIASTNTTQDNWYKYDAMNRFVTTKGSFSGTLGSGSIVTGSAGSALAYNFDGTRATMVDASSSEAYTYTADGLIAKATIGGVQRASYAYDTMGRLLNYSEYDSGGSTVVYSRDATYDAKSQVLSDIVMNKVSGVVTTKTSTYDYTAAVSYNSTTHLYTYGGAYQGGVVTHIATTTVTGSTTTHQDTQNTFYWYDSALESSQLYMADTTHPTVYNYNAYSRDSTNTLDNVVITDGHPRTVQFLSNAVGQILKRDENASGSSNTPHELRYSFNNQIVGYVSNNGTSDTDYAAAITQHTTATGTGYYRNGGTSSVAYADFDQSYEPLNGNALDSSAGSYTVMQGDSLQSIAASVWGDSSLWYLIADANGMTAGSELQAGQTVSIPNRVHNIHNNASTFKVYDPNSAIGDVAPSVPKSKNNHCGVFGQILLAIIAIAIVALTFNPLAAYFGGLLGSTTAGAIVGGAVAGAAGSIVSQGVGLATGIQSKFDWGGLAMAAIGGAITGGLGPKGINAFASLEGTITDVGVNVLRSVAGNVLTQGIGVATGLQKKFDWAGVAAAGVGAAVGTVVGHWIGPAFKAGGSMDLGSAVFNRAAVNLISGMASNIANAATRTLIDGSDFGDNLIAALPDTIGQTIGGMISDEIQVSNDTSALEAAGWSHDTASAASDAALTGDLKAFFSAIGHAGAGLPGDTPQAVAAKIGEVQSYLNVLGKIDPEGAATLTKEFNYARLAIAPYFPDAPGIVPAGFTRVTQKYLDDNNIKFDMHLLDTTKTDGYMGLLFHDDVNGGFVLADRGSRGLANTFESIQDYKNNFANQFGYESPEFNDAVLAAVMLNDQLDERTPLTFVGHSLGGGFAISQALVTGRSATVFDSEAPSAGTLNKAVAYVNNKLEQTLYADYDNAGLLFDEKYSVTAYHVESDPVTLGQNNRGLLGSMFTMLHRFDTSMSTRDIFKEILPEFMLQEIPPQEMAKPPIQVGIDIGNGPASPPGVMLPMMEGYDAHSMMALFAAIQNQVIAREAHPGR